MLYLSRDKLNRKIPDIINTGCWGLLTSITALLEKAIPSCPHISLDGSLEVGSKHSLDSCCKIKKWQESSLLYNQQRNMKNKERVGYQKCSTGKGPMEPSAATLTEALHN